jgi:hypothetical protein
MSVLRREDAVQNVQVLLISQLRKDKAPAKRGAVAGGGSTE